jgi:hypothetical protein
MVATGLLSSLIAMAGEAPSTAASQSPVRVHVSLTGIDVCGFTVDSVVTGTDKAREFTDKAGNLWVQDESHIVSALTNEANGKVVYVDSAGRDLFQPIPVLNPDGTITTIDTLTGRPERVYTSHSDVLVRDAGLVTILNTFDSNGDLMDTTMTVHGVHQVSGPDEAFCAAITSALG